MTEAGQGPSQIDPHLGLETLPVTVAPMNQARGRSSGIPVQWKHDAGSINFLGS